MARTKNDGAAAPEDFYWRLVAQNSTDSIVVSNVEGRVEWVNDPFERLTGYSIDEVRDHTLGEVLNGPDTDPVTIDQIADAIATRRALRTEVLNYAKDQRPFWVELSLAPVFDDGGQHTHFVSVERDISDRKKAEARNIEVVANEAHRETERKLLAQVSEWLYSAKSLDELLMVVCKALETLIPEAEGALYIFSPTRDTLELAAQWGGVDAPGQLNADACWALRRGRAYSFGTKAIEFPCDHVHDDTHPFFCLPIIAHGETIGLLHLCISAFDLSIIPRESLEEFMQQRWELSLLCAEQISLAVANVQLRQELQDQSVRDPLTNLWNRRWFLDAAQRAMNASNARQSGVALISFDVDHFKSFNDRFGHDAGDVVLREVGSLLTQVFTGSMSPCRIGGEEFVVLCTETTLDDAMSRAEVFRESIAAQDLTYGTTSLPKITVSGGVAVYPDHGEEVIDLMKAADEALYAAKSAGRDRIIAAGTLPKAASKATKKAG